MLVLILLGTVAAGCGWVLTGRVIGYARRHAILDNPNDRSLHAVPTPRGGGLAIAWVTLPVIALLGLAGRLDPRTTMGLVAGGVLVASAGWLDDRRGLPVGARALCHLGAAAAVILGLGGVTTLRLGTTVVPLGVGGNALAILVIAWSINLYNFMDGIDGLAAGQAVVAGGIGAVLLARGGQAGLAWILAVTAGTALGFLAWNWSPARIFMGDVGSGLLGFLFGAVALVSEVRQGPPLVLWVLLLGVFIFDASVTLVRRMVRRERWYAAHRLHAYQRAVQSGWSHRQVTTVALLLMGLLGGLALIGATYPEWSWVAVGAGLLLLSACYVAIEIRHPMRGGG